MKRRDLIKALEKAGYQIARDRGDHTVYRKDNSQPVEVPRHTEIKGRTAQQILKDAGLK